uniref:Uncharacterized protein n=1 Tax=Ditylenchus dipsaci TaxID=166011 RepID=A0A915E5X0_9BILA
MPGQKIKLQHAEDLHSQPISKMGEYAEYMRRLAAIGAAPQRELEPQAARPHAFGNPFKLDKKSMLVDEVGEMSAENAANSSMSGNKEAQQERRPNGIENRIGRPRRMKRKPGPLDPNALNSRARRSRSCSETGSETSSVSSELSDLSSVAEADNMGIEKEEFSDDEEDILVIEEQSPCFSSNSHLSSYVQNGLPISSEQKTSSSEPSTSETKLNGFSTKHSTGLNNHKPAYLSLTPAQLSERQMSLSRIVRGIGNRFTVFDKCLEVVQETSRQEKRILLNYALREARRFKRQELVRRLERQLKSMAH